MRGEQLIYPAGSDTIEPFDKVIVVTTEKTLMTLTTFWNRGVWMNIKTVRYFVGKDASSWSSALSPTTIVSFIYQESLSQKLAYAGTILILLVIGSLLSFKSQSR